MCLCDKKQPPKATTHTTSIHHRQQDSKTTRQEKTGMKLKRVVLAPSGTSTLRITFLHPQQEQRQGPAEAETEAMIGGVAGRVCPPAGPIWTAAEDAVLLSMRLSQMETKTKTKETELELGTKVSMSMSMPFGMAGAETGPGRGGRDGGWRAISAAVGRIVGSVKSAKQCAQRWNRVVNPILHKGAWTDDEDDALYTAVLQCGTGSWMQIARIVRTRSDVQCRTRWLLGRNRNARNARNASALAAAANTTVPNTTTVGNTTPRIAALDQHGGPDQWLPQPAPVLALLDTPSPQSHSLSHSLFHSRSHSHSHSASPLHQPNKMSLAFLLN